jgi:hypothetical protein
MNLASLRVLALAMLAAAYVVSIATPVSAFIGLDPNPPPPGSCVDPQPAGWGKDNDSSSPSSTADNDEGVAGTGLTVSAVWVKDGESIGDFCVKFTENGTYIKEGVECYRASGFGTSGPVLVVNVNPTAQICGAISHLEWVADGTTTTTTTTGTTGTTGPGATPELDSFVLFGVGVLGMAGYALYKRRRGLPPS